MILARVAGSSPNNPTRRSRLRLSGGVSTRANENQAMCDEVDLLTERIRDLAKDLDAMEAQYCDLQAQV